jgi:hypothetical protein
LSLSALSFFPNEDFHSWCLVPFRIVVTRPDNQQILHSEQSQQQRSDSRLQQEEVKTTKKLTENEMILFSSEAKVVFNPWIRLNGEINSSLLRQLKASLFNIVFRNPGISQVCCRDGNSCSYSLFVFIDLFDMCFFWIQKAVCEKISAFRPAVIIELLNHLELANVIYSKLIPISPSTTLFSELCSLPQPRQEPNISQFEKCYWPTSDALQKMADILDN